ncbi:MFS transporter [Candidatus Parcubacteria bacterium]|nr:MFS transporter [Candidatus Parcubacteria bacterium]
MPGNLQSNIWKHVIFLITNKRNFTAILGAYYLTIPNVTPQGIGIILLAGSLSGFLFEIPSGYISDKIGHKQALILGKSLLIFSSLFFLIANNILVLILASVFMSIAYSFFSGTGSAFMYETLHALKKEKDYTRIMGKIRSIGYLVPVILIVLIPFLVSINIRLPFVIALFIDIIGLLIAYSYVAPKVSQAHIEEIGVTNFKKILSQIYRIGFMKYALFLGILSGFLFAVNGFRAAYQYFLQIPIIYYGLFFGAGFALASLLIAYSGKIKASTTLSRLFAYQIIIFALLFFMLGIISSWWAVILIFILVIGLQHGLITINEGFMMDILKNEKFKATLLSVPTQIQKIATAIIGLGLGIIIKHTSYKFGFFVTGIAFCVILTPIYLYILRKEVLSKVYTALPNK